MKRTISLLAALAEPTRFAAMRLLADNKEHCVCELMRALGVRQSSMSRHMAALKKCGLVVDRRDAQWVRFRLNPSLSKETRVFLRAAFALEGTL